MMSRLHFPFIGGFGGRADATDLGRKLHMDACRCLDMTKLVVVLSEAVEAGRLHPRKAELYYMQASALLAQLTGDMIQQDPGWHAVQAGQTGPVGRLREAFAAFTRRRPENEGDYAALGREAVATAHDMLAAVPPPGEAK